MRPEQRTRQGICQFSHNGQQCVRNLMKLTIACKGLPAALPYACCLRGAEPLRWRCNLMLSLPSLCSLCLDCRKLICGECSLCKRTLTRCVVFWSQTLIHSLLLSIAQSRGKAASSFRPGSYLENFTPDPALSLAMPLKVHSSIELLAKNGLKAHSGPTHLPANE